MEAMSSYQELGPEEPQGWSPLAVAMIATLVLLLGLAGALFGIYVSNVNAQAAAATGNPTPRQVPPSPSAVPTTSKPSTPTPTPTPSPTPTPTPSPSAPPGSFPLPNLVGQNFKDARTAVRDLDLAWTLTFEGNGTDQTVRQTNPSATTLVQKGTNITIVVKGAAPLATAPNIVGKQCAQAVAMIIDAGLYPDYKSNARTGVVVAPVVPPVGLHWNDKMPLTCSG
jgi:hypothetical protein